MGRGNRIHPRKAMLSLQWKVSLLIIGPMVLVLALSTVMSYFQHRDMDLSSMSLVAAQTGEVIEYVLQRDMLRSDTDQIQATIDAIGQDSRILALYVLDLSGRVVFAPQGQGVGRRLSNTQPTCLPCHRLPAEERPSGVVVETAEGQPIFRSMNPIENQPRCYGCHDPDQRINGLLLTDISIAPVEASLAADLRSNLAWWSGTLVITVILANLVVNRWVLSRLQGLFNALADIGRHGLTGRLPEEPGDEIGRLSSAFNAMADQIEKREHENLALAHRLQEQARTRGALLERLINAQEEERKRVARELHDELGQGLSSTSLQIEMAQRTIERDPQKAREYLTQSHQLIEEATDRMYDLILGLRPSALDDLGLVAALRSHAQRTLQPAGLNLEIESLGMRERLPAMIETALFRILQEALNNVLRHAQASQVRLLLSAEDGYVRGEVIDNGLGFDPSDCAAIGPEGRGLGLMGMRERAAYLGGRLEIDSRLGEGTRVRVQIPIAEFDHA